MNKTTKKDFEMFKMECEKWIDFWGLKEYSYNFYHEKRESRGLAFSRLNASDYWASLILNTNWCEHKITDLKIKECAFHEVAHVLLERLFSCATARFLSEEEINSELESVIKRMENCIFKTLTK